jgi:hypothetical protein
MSEDRRQILGLLSEGKITPDEAERLISALGGVATPRPAYSGTAEPARANRPKYMRVMVDANEPGEGPTKVNIRVPIQLLRAGVRLSSLIPPQARDQVNAAMTEYGVPFDLSKLKPENLEELIEQLSDLTVDVDNERAKVRIFCE